MSEAYSMSCKYMSSGFLINIPLLAPNKLPPDIKTFNKYYAQLLNMNRQSPAHSDMQILYNLICFSSSHHELHLTMMMHREYSFKILYLPHQDERSLNALMYYNRVIRRLTVIFFCVELCAQIGKAGSYFLNIGY